MKKELKPLYVLITAARNEEKYIEKTIKAVINQTVLPKKWVIVSDNSTDKTDEIINKYEKKYNFIKLIQNKGDDKRNFGSQVKAINKGYEFIKNLDYDYIGNLDADISFESDYYEKIISCLIKNKKLGLAGGFVYEENNGEFNVKHTRSLNSVPHAIQLFKREVFEKIGGYIELKYGGPDWCAEVMVRMNNWEVRSFKEIPVYHLKPILTGEGLLKGAFRQGLMDHSLGAHPIFQILKCLSMIFYKPLFLYSFTRIYGFIIGYIKNEKRAVSKDFINFLRKEQIDRLLRFKF